MTNGNLIEALGWMLIHSLWQGASVGGVLWIGLRLARSSSARLQYAVSCFALLAIVVLAGATLARETQRVRSISPTVVEMQAGPVERLSNADAANPDGTTNDGPEIARNEASIAVNGTSEPANPRASWLNVIAFRLERLLPWIVGAWSVGILVSILRLGCSWNRVQQLRRSGQPLDPSDWNHALRCLKEQMQISYAVQFVTSATVRVPMVIGWMKPMVLLPFQLLTSLSREQVLALIAHELGHIRRHDYLVNLIQSAVETLFFFHPAVWWISSRIREERENCCDDLASIAMGGPLPYVKALSALEQTRIERVIVAATGSSLLNRVRRLLMIPSAEGPGSSAPLSLGIIAGIAALVGLSIALGQEPGPKSTEANQPLGEERWRSINAVKRGEIWTPGQLQLLPFGPKSSTGLRAAWIFEPMRDEYHVGAALTSRVVIHNAGSEPVEFLANEYYLRDAEWSVTDANGLPRTLTKTRYAGGEDRATRLAPGEAMEFRAYGLGLSLDDFDLVYGQGPIAMKLATNVGDELRCKWAVKLRSAQVLSDAPDAPNPAPLKLETGEVKFRVVAQPPNAAPAVGVATGPGYYRIAPGMKLRIHQIPMGPPRIFVNGVEKLPEPGTQKEIKLMNSAHLELAEGSKSVGIGVPNGEDSYVVAWERGTKILWVGEPEWVRKVDVSTVGRFPAAEILENVDPLNRAEVEKFLQNAGTGAPEQRWKWEDPGDFGGISAHVKAALVQNRPRAQAKPESPESAFPMNEDDPRLPWQAVGKVTDSDGKPMPDVEIWVHAGMGSLKRTGIAKTDADGRYKVNFGPGVLMEKDSPQLQVANVTAHKPGFFERNLSRHGRTAAATREVGPLDLEDHDIKSDELFLPNKPRELNFVMLPGATVKGRLLGTGSFPRLPPQDFRGKEEKPIAGHIVHRRAPLARWKVWLTGPQLPPGSSVFASAETDAEGRFEFQNVPTGFQWQIQADTHHREKDPRSPLFTPTIMSEDIEVEVEMNEAQETLRFTGEPRAAR